MKKATDIFGVVLLLCGGALFVLAAAGGSCIVLPGMFFTTVGSSVVFRDRPVLGLLGGIALSVLLAIVASGISMALGKPHFGAD